MNALTLAALGTGFTFLMTAAGAAVVFLFKNEIKPSFQRVFLGFAAGVMLAASVWSLLLPAIERAEAGILPVWLALGGFSDRSFRRVARGASGQIYAVRGDRYGFGASSAGYIHQLKIGRSRI